MRRDVGVKETATLMRENEEDVENAEGDCRDGEEINRGKLRAVVFQKCSPVIIQNSASLKVCAEGAC